MIVQNCYLELPFVKIKKHGKLNPRANINL